MKLTLADVDTNGSQSFTHTFDATEAYNAGYAAGGNTTSLSAVIQLTEMERMRLGLTPNNTITLGDESNETYYKVESTYVNQDNETVVADVRHMCVPNYSETIKATIRNNAQEYYTDGITLSTEFSDTYNQHVYVIDYDSLQ